jgi:hypothetical protein
MSSIQISSEVQDKPSSSGATTRTGLTKAQAATGNKWTAMTAASREMRFMRGLATLKILQMERDFQRFFMRVDGAF